MLSIGTLSVGNEHYYLHTVAGGVEDYYFGRGEAPGRWVGVEAGELGLDGRVDAERLAAALAGQDPGDGVRLVRTRSDRVPGFDLTFRAPKSVSVLFGLADNDVAREVRTAHDVAVDAAFAFLEREACGTRRGTNGVDAVNGSRFVGAGFRHRTSRAGDPHLHTHVLVANFTRTPDDRYGALDARRVYLYAKTAGYLYEAQLRDELTRRLGVEWGPVRNGIADIVGIPQPVLDGFSTRRAEIEEEMTRRGVTSARAAEIAALDTRQAKDCQVDPATLRARWSDQAQTFGLTPEMLASAIGRIEPRRLGDRDAERIIRELIGPNGLTARASTFDRRDVLRAWCDRLTDGAEIATIEALTDRTLDDPSIVVLEGDTVARLRRRANGHTIDGPSLGPRYSTIELITLEQRLVDHAADRRDRDVGVVDEVAVLDALRRRPELSGEQVDLVVQLTTGGDGIDVVIAPAGTGKTFALDAARDAWQRAGYHVIGASLAARAAAELEATAGIPAQTIARLLVDLEHPVHGGLSAGSVLVVDEAGMVGTRTLARLLDHASRADAKVVLVGDPRQLPEIDAGGLLRGLGDRLDPIRLVTNRGQHEPWERAALALLRDGEIDHALDAYHAHDRIISAPTATMTRETMVADWWAARLAGQRALMVAARWYDVDDLNARARQRVEAHGLLSGPVIEIDGRPFQSGDEIMTLRNQRRLGVRNGTVGVVSAVDPDSRAVTIRSDHGEHTLPSEYLDAGHIRHAYATTIHKAQGLTVDHALVLGDDTLYQEAGYVALSRGRAQNRLYLVAQPDDHEHHGRAPERSPIEQLASALRVSRAQELAIDQRVDTPTTHQHLVHLYDQRDRVRAVLRGAPSDQTATIRALQASRDELGRSPDNERGKLEHRYPIRHRKQHTTRRIATIRNVDLLETRLDDTERALASAIAQRDARTSFLAEHQVAVDQLPTTERDIERRLDQLIDSYRHAPPEYLTALGPRPTATDARAHWNAAARVIKEYRHDHRVTDARNAFGPTNRADLEQQVASAQVEGILEGRAHDVHRLGLDLG